MSDDFGTINVHGPERAREIEAMRQHFQRHRDALARMVADSPTETLAVEYRRLAGQIDESIARLDEIEQPLARSPSHPPTREVPWGPQVHDEPTRVSAPGLRPIAHAPHDPHEMPDFVSVDDGSGGGNRVLLILMAAFVALGVLGWLIWRASSDRPGAPVVETVAPPTETVIVPLTPAPAPPARNVLAIVPQTQDYGVIRKGTRGTRRYQILNDGDAPVTIQLKRSACRCLYYDYDNLIPPKGRQSVVVTVDGAKAQAGALRESIAVTSKSNPSITATLEVVASVE